MPATPLNENFWLCHCDPPDDVRNALLEGHCPKCGRSQLKAPLASQQQVNESAQALAERQRVQRAFKPELPQPRKKEPPTREEFEAALDYLNKPYSASDCSYNTWNSRLKHAEHTIKRYKHYHAENDRKTSSAGLRDAGPGGTLLPLV